MSQGKEFGGKSKIYSVNLNKNVILVLYGKKSVAYQMLLLRNNNKAEGVTPALVPQEVDKLELLWKNKT